MFESLTNRLTGLFSQLGGGSGRLTEDSIKDAVREVKRALLEADVSLPVARDFTKAVKAKAVGAEGVAGVSHAQQFERCPSDLWLDAHGSPLFVKEPRIPLPIALWWIRVFLDQAVESGPL